MKYDLALVMPVYNEEACILDVVTKWHRSLVQLNINFVIFVINDGSKDATKDILKRLSLNDDVIVINKENSGHGPTVLLGYHRAVKISEWVFQVDSDDEMPPDSFQDLWNKRDRYDALFGTRVGRRQNISRKLISATSRVAISLLFGKGVVDVNTPYRLMKSAMLAKIIDIIPENTFAPNLIISGCISKANYKIYNHNVPHENRKTGTVSIVKLKLLKSSVLAMIQTINLYMKCKYNNR
jgi:glycosyltransferase involved in cell wall biosynthesis